MPRKKTLKRKGTIDAETDPFLHGRIPQPFLFGLYIDGIFESFWGDDCVNKIVKTIKSLGKCVLYAHNGGKFDFHYLLPFANRDEILIINGRIASLKIGEVVLKDSFLLMPFSLATYKKTEIDYRKFERDVRWKHKKEIINYLKDDCIDLYDLVTGFHKNVGDHLTIGAAAFANMKKCGIEITKGTEANDERFRQYFFGGRTQAFEIGIFTDEFTYIDINSAYPAAMRHEHPSGYKYITTDKLPRRKLSCEFITFTGRSYGALPVRDDDGILHFPADGITRVYNCTGWELQAGLDTGTIIIEKIHSVQIPTQTRNFKPFVDNFFPLKNACKRSGDKIGELSYKYLVNSGYGKWATNPRKFKEYMLADYGDYLDDYWWDFDIGDISVWSRSSYDGNGFYDVAVAASITGFVRAYMWRTLLQCDRPMYCDTDSIICKKISKSVTVSTKLGDWKVEETIKKLAIAGKKLYAYSNESGEWESRSKGARLEYTDILNICEGDTVNWKNEAPNFSLKYGARFISRDIKMRAKK